MKWLQWPYLFILGALDRKTPLGGTLRLPLCILGSAWGLVTLERERWRNLLGWAETYHEPTREGGFWHWYKNRTTEWTRRDPQRASKVFSFLLCLWAAVAVVGWAT